VTGLLMISRKVVPKPFSSAIAPSKTMLIPSSS
jgi:hypothetical protein